MNEFNEYNPNLLPPVMAFENGGNPPVVVLDHHRGHRPLNAVGTSFLPLHDATNLDLLVDQYTSTTFARLVAKLASTRTLRNLRIVRSADSGLRKRTKQEMQGFLLAMLGGKHHSSVSSSYSLRCHPVARLTSLRLDHVSREDIRGLPTLLENHPSLQDVGIQLFPYYERRIPLALSKALASMPKLNSLQLGVSSGPVLITREEYFKGKRKAARGASYFPRLTALQVSLQEAKPVLLLTKQLASPLSSCMALQELHLKTDCRPEGLVVESIADMMVHTQSLQELRLCFRSHPLDDSACIALGNALKLNTTLVCLGLGPWLDRMTALKGGRSPTEAISRQGGCKALIGALKQHMKLESLTFQGLYWPGEEEEDQDSSTMYYGTDIEDEEGYGTDYEDWDDIGEEEEDSVATDEAIPWVGADEEDEEPGEDWYDARDKEDWHDALQAQEEQRDDDESRAGSFSTKTTTLSEEDEDAPSFPLVVSFYLGLNRCGRANLLQNDATKFDWVDMLATQDHHLSRVYYFLRSNPALFQD